MIDEHGQPEVETGEKHESSSHALGIGSSYPEVPLPTYVCPEPFSVEKAPVTQGWNDALTLEEGTSTRISSAMFNSPSPLLMEDLPELSIEDDEGEESPAVEAN